MAPQCHAKGPELNLLFLMCIPPSWSATPASLERQMKRLPELVLPKQNRKTSVYNELEKALQVPSRHPRGSALKDHHKECLCGSQAKDKAK